MATAIGNVKANGEYVRYRRIISFFSWYVKMVLLTNIPVGSYFLLTR
jgi:hypothetical protein